MSGAVTGRPWPAPAKLNLFLHVTGRRADGYHELQTAFQFLDVGDVLWFEVTDGGGIELECGLPRIPAAQNLIVRAARRLADHTGCSQGARIRAEKRLPVGGGLGGGSSDAATTLVALNVLWGLGLDADELAWLGLQLGADVPVFVRGAAAWAEGVGEKLTPLPELVEPWYLVVHPAVSVSTAEIFSDPELTRNTHPLKIPAFLSGAGVNCLEPVVVRRYPEVGKALNWLSKHQPARMTGSGACVFSACKDRHQAESILKQLPIPWTGFVSRGCNRSPLLERLEQRHI
ncbi:MAG: 4-(cytidine 5'-diphospho)-2-C-methyl-D-erythritol kinase [Pseudomonadota bacterium]|nr:4-(cytidine 5'-diphospho)-2-C-methyl-D-erythritol kinase [Pseudomonadota bacterium]